MLTWKFLTLPLAPTACPLLAVTPKGFDMNSRRRNLRKPNVALPSTPTGSNVKHHIACPSVSANAQPRSGLGGYATVFP